MTRLERALRWWKNSRYKCNEIPKEYRIPLEKAKYLDGDELNDKGIAAAKKFKRNPGGPSLDLWLNLDSSPQNLAFPNRKALTSENANKIQWLLSRLTYQGWEVFVDRTRGLRITSDNGRPLTRGHWKVLSFYFNAIPLDSPFWLLLPDEIIPAIMSLTQMLRRVKDIRREQDLTEKMTGG